MYFMKISYYFAISIATILQISQKATLFFKGSLCNSHWRIGRRIKANYPHVDLGLRGKYLP